MIQNKEYYLQISAGVGQEECCRAVFLFFEYLNKIAKKQNKLFEVIEKISSKSAKKCYKSVLIKIDNKDFFAQYVGTILWVSQSPFRKNHKRKNWFIGIEIIDLDDDISFKSTDIIIEKTRAGGPGGQHVNKTESAIKITHLPTKLTAISSEQRCQHANKKMALLRLKLLIDELNASRKNQTDQNIWAKHHQLERGNPIKTFLGTKFQEK